MSCESTPTATLFGTTVISTLSVSTLVFTEIQTITSTGFTLIETCIPTTITSPTISIIPITTLLTTSRTIPLITTITFPTETLFGSCRHGHNYNQPKTQTVTVTKTVTTTAVEPVYVTPTVHLKRIPTPNVLLQTSPPESNQYGSSSSSSTNTPAIIGGVVGGIAALIAIIVIIILYKKRSGSWHDGHRAGAAGPMRERPAVDDDGSSPKSHGYGALSSLSKGDQHSAAHMHSRSASTTTGYADHGRTNSHTPLILAGSSAHSPPSSLARLA